MLVRSRFLVFLACSLLASASHAITYDFAFDDVNAGATGDLMDFAGTYDVTGSITFADGAMDLDGGSGGRFEDITGFVLEADGLQIFDLGDIDSFSLGIDFESGRRFIDVFATFDDSSIPQAQGLEFFDANLRMSFTFDPADFDPNMLPTELPEAAKSIFSLNAKVGETKKGDGGALGVPDDDIGPIVITGSLRALGRAGSLSVAPDENPIPEPTAAFLFAGGLLVTAHHLRRRR